MSTQVYVQMDGIVNHRHEGVKGWHDPATTHKDADLHKREKAARPTNLKDLNEDQARQYGEALGGKSFYGLWREAKDARVAEGKKTRGPSKATQELDARARELDELEALAVASGLRE